MELTQEELNLIMDLRAKKAYDQAYNAGLQDCYNVILGTIPAGETRQEALNIIKSLLKGV